MFDSSPALNVIPTLLDRLPKPADTTPLPWGTAPVPPLQPLPPRPVYAKKTPTKESTGTSGRTRSKTRLTAAVTVSTQPGPSSVAVPPVERPVVPAKPSVSRTRPVVRPRPIPLGSVTLRGVPGSSHRGVDLVSYNYLMINNLLFSISI